MVAHVFIRDKLLAGPTSDQKILNQGLVAYQEPDIDPSLEQELIRYMSKRKGND
jgi:hypothetical protein